MWISRRTFSTDATVPSKFFFVLHMHLAGSSSMRCADAQGRGERHLRNGSVRARQERESWRARATSSCHGNHQSMVLIRERERECVCVCMKHHLRVQHVLLLLLLLLLHGDVNESASENTADQKSVHILSCTNDELPQRSMSM
jgi:hypothetical protein